MPLSVSVSEPASGMNVKSMLAGGGEDVALPRYTGTVDCVRKIWRFVHYSRHLTGMYSIHPAS